MDGKRTRTIEVMMTMGFILPVLIVLQADETPDPLSLRLSSHVPLSTDLSTSYLGDLLWESGKFLEYLKSLFEKK